MLINKLIKDDGSVRELKNSLTNYHNIILSASLYLLIQFFVDNEFVNITDLLGGRNVRNS